MRYNKIRKMDISNGPGVRVSLFVQGCTFNCKGCFNPETHDFSRGKEFTDTQIDRILSLCSKEYIEGLSILGGEPLHPKNIKTITDLVKNIKTNYPNKTIWIWSGYLFEDIIKRENYDVLNYIDVLVDGQFKEDQKDITLKYCGSRNQRVIDINKTLKEKEIILWS